MLYRYFTALICLLIVALIIKNLFSPKQQHQLHQWAWLLAKILLYSTALALLWRLFQAA